MMALVVWLLLRHGCPQFLHKVVNDDRDSVGRSPSAAAQGQVMVANGRRFRLRREHADKDVGKVADLTRRTPLSGPMRRLGLRN